jgi:hypothetical protein
MNSAHQLSEAICERLKNSARCLRIARTVFLGIAAFAAGGAQFLEFWPNAPQGWQIVGLTSCGIILVGAIFFAIADDNAPEQLEIARRAIEEAEQATFEASLSGEIVEELEDTGLRFSHLYLACMAMRGALEHVEGLKARDSKAFAGAVLESVHPFLPTALAVETWHRWTFGVYEIQGDSPKELVCVAHRRAVECEIQDARRWPTDRGVMGVAVSRRQEVIVADSREPSVRSVFGLSHLEKEGDDQRYVAFAVCPVLIGNSDTVWGVVIATNDQADHFSDEISPSAVEIVRAVSAMMALGVSIRSA